MKEQRPQNLDTDPSLHNDTLSAEQEYRSNLPESGMERSDSTHDDYYKREEQPEDDHDEADEETKGKNETWEWIKALAIAVLIAIAIRTFLFAPIVVDGTSMLPTLHDKERLIVNKAIYLLSEPKRGDILVFHAEFERDWIKRVIGEPGDVVEVQNDQLFINGEPYEESYLEESKALAGGPLTEDFKVEVPDGHIFVMGDNRLNSRDSRSIGPIPIDTVVGRADIVFWPISELQFLD